MESLPASDIRRYMLTAPRLRPRDVQLPTYLLFAVVSTVSLPGIAKREICGSERKWNDITQDSSTQRRIYYVCVE